MHWRKDSNRVQPDLLWPASQESTIWSSVEPDGVHIFTACFSKIPLNGILPCRLGVSGWSPPFPFSLTVYTIFLILPRKATYPGYLIQLDLIAAVILCKRYKLWRFSLCNFLHSPYFLSMRSRTLRPLRLIEMNVPTQEKWLQHVQRMDTNRLPKQALQYKPKGRRNIGRPRKRWRVKLHLEDQGTGNTPKSSWTWWWWWWMSRHEAAWQLSQYAIGWLSFQLPLRSLFLYFFQRMSDITLNYATGLHPFRPQHFSA
jgi:hypothetical protein